MSGTAYNRQLKWVWSSMKQRCHNPNDKSYARYGAKGIQVCQSWRDSFDSFISDMGPRPDGHTLERIDSKGNYEPGNVRWATYTEQARNTSRNHLHTIGGVTKCLAEWCEITGESWSAVKKRVAAGRDPFERTKKRRIS